MEWNAVIGLGVIVLSAVLFLVGHAALRRRNRPPVPLAPEVVEAIRTAKTEQAAWEAQQEKNRFMDGSGV